jgi:hypothetical protein
VFLLRNSIPRLDSPSRHKWERISSIFVIVAIVVIVIVIIVIVVIIVVIIIDVVIIVKTVARCQNASKPIALAPQESGFASSAMLDML